MNTKIAVLVALLGSLGFCKAGLQPNIAVKCSQQSGIDIATVSTAFHGYNVDSLNMKGKCFLSCAMSETKAIHPDGSLDKAKAMANLPTQMAEYFDQCQKAGSTSDPCENAYLFYKCIFDVAKAGH